MVANQADLMRTISERHRQALQAFVIRLTNDRELAEDVVQVTLLRAWQRPAVLQFADTALRNWLFTVAHNLVIDTLRSAPRRHELGTDRVPETAAADQTDRVLDAWAVRDALDQLSTEQRDIIVHSYFQDETLSEIAETLHIPQGTAKSRLHYALRALRLALRERGATPS